MAHCPPWVDPRSVAANMPNLQGWVLVTPNLRVVGHLLVTVESDRFNCTVIAQQCFIDGRQPGARAEVNRILERVAREAGASQIMAVTQREPRAFGRAFGCEPVAHLMRKVLS